MTTMQDEVEAAELEGFFEVGGNPFLVGLYAQYKSHRAAEAAARKAKGRVADRILEQLKEYGAKVFTIGGQPMMREQVVEDTTIFDTERHKKEHPDCHAQYMTKKKSGSIRVWVRPQNGDDLSEDAA